MNNVFLIVCMFVPNTLLFYESVFAQEINPITSFIKKIEEADFPNTDIDNCNIVRIKKDLNGDNLEDLMLSSTNCAWGSKSGWGNAGGSWAIYYKTENNYFTYIDTVFFHPLAVRITPQKDKNGFLLDIYWRSNSAQGSLITLFIAPEIHKTIAKKTISPGSNLSGKDAALYESLFGSNYKNPLSENCSLHKIKTGDCVWEKGYH